ncbi:GtrA family protein [Haloparvum sedimenti]|uniref:GtrA family protein n=1 Tax=Haloparvum sedimenti TaxID=1678448 RepID=UPI00071E7B00|nr:GtrA family protein [Haloparvum sedimenti]
MSGGAEGPAGEGGTSEADGTVATLASGTRFGQFVSVGVVGFGFDIVTSTALEALGVFPELAAFVGIEVAVVVMFLLNDRVTFAEEGLAGIGPTLRRLAKSNLVRAGGIAVQLLVFTALYRGIALPLTVSGIDLWFVASRAGGVGVGMLVNYVAESLLTWRVTADR